jgi:hypothetical protein
MQGHAVLVQLLLEHGADPALRRVRVACSPCPCVDGIFTSMVLSSVTGNWQRAKISLTSWRIRIINLPE